MSVVSLVCVGELRDPVSAGSTGRSPGIELAQKRSNAVGDPGHTSTHLN